MEKSAAESEDSKVVEDADESKNVVSSQQSEKTDETNILNEESYADDCIDNIEWMGSSSQDIISTSKQNIEQTSIDSDCPDENVIEEIFVDNWTGFESLESSTSECVTHSKEEAQFYDGTQPYESSSFSLIEETLRESYEESIDIHYERDLQDIDQQRYYNKLGIG